MEILTDAFYEELAKAIAERPDAEGMDEEQIVKLTTDALKESLPELAASLRCSLDDEGFVAATRKDEASFCERNAKRWSLAFDGLCSLVGLCREIGSEFNKRYRPIAVDKQDVVFDVLVRLHARGCQIASEVLWLMEGGFADGAHARWRALHEVAVTAAFVDEHGQDCAIKYCHHEIVEAYKAMTQHKSYEDQLNEKAHPGEEIAECKAAYDELVQKYGAGFAQPNGWASEALGKQRVSFADIESKVRLDHYRPYYKMASHNVHAGAKGITWRLGLSETGSIDVLLSGRSNTGMGTPGHSTAISLTQLTATLISIAPNVDELVGTQIALTLVDEIGRAFVECSQKAPEDSMP